ncbi:hypothetical protein HNP38_003417 [Chryseobacterium defluvii]|uniref:Dolichyl-phosphate-mannose-protein mannosyltransferase n=1 Tax=Chryseobacterium defluvii TaxID=160396 RepID=A0A840KJH9_9FLAO|nr:glycosyltransferase family 39 protein [Chryseobacterium defluvii]MBB4808077.1 hypothetical protein [Chryseobacterium defluvii]
MKRNLFFLLTLLLFTLCIIVSIGNVVSFAGRYIYPLDDAYIHLSIAKNFALHHVWGITKYEFSSTTSSPFFTLLLAGFIKFFGNYEYWPIVLNLIAAFFLIVCVNNIFKTLSNRAYLLCLNLVIWCMPLFTMVLIGMEHVFHTLFLLLSLFYFKKYSEDHLSKNFALLLLFAVLSVGFRYESLFFIFFICAYLFFVEKKFQKSILLGVASLLPVIIYGIISIQNGSYFLPNSLILKGNTSDGGISGFVIRVLGNGYRGLSLLPLVVFLMIFIFKNKRSGLLDFLKSNNLQIVILLGFTLHLLFANFGWLVRYEAYLFVLLVYVLKDFIEEILNSGKQFLKFAFILLLALPVYLRTWTMFEKQTLASKNIFDQQIQMADFLKKYYNQSKVVANDIGAIAYFTDIRLLDTYGLGTIEIAKIRKNDHGEFNIENPKLRNFVYQYSKNNNYDIALVFDNWLHMPDNFQKTGEWTIKDNYICGGPKVSFYSIKPDEKNNLIKNLKEFRVSMPKDVEVKISDN